VTKHGDAPVAKKQLRTVKHPAAKGIAFKTASRAKEKKPGLKVMHIKVAATQPLPWYFNPIVLWVEMSLFAALCAIVGACCHKRGIARGERDSFGKAIEKDFKKFFSKFRKGGTCQPAV